MAAPSGIRSGVGFRNVVLFGLNVTGTPAATATTPYEGVKMSGAKTLTINDPEPRRMNHVGDDTLITIDVLPPIEALAGELHTGKIDDDVEALVTGQKKFSVGEAALFGVATEKRGYENQVGLLAYRQAQDTDPDSPTFGMRLWDFRIMPKVILYTRDTGFTDQVEDHTYTVVPAKSGAHLWGTPFALATEGFKQAQMVRGVSRGKPKLVAFLADGVASAFNFPVDFPARNTASIVVWKNGTLVSTAMTATVTGITFTAPLPVANDVIVVFYETN